MSQPLSTPFPNPPDYYQSFTNKNLSELRDLEARHLQQHGSDAQLKSSDLPAHLRNLRPPTPPAPGEVFSVFGEERTLAARPPPIPADERVLLPPAAGEDSSPTSARLPAPSPQGLLRLTRSILLSYLELLQILVANPSGAEYGPKWEDLRDLFRNVHGMLNQYRAWQGREALIQLMERVIAQGKQAETDWAEVEGRVEGLLQRISTEGGGEADAAERQALEAAAAEDWPRRDQSPDPGMQERRHMWALLGASTGMEMDVS